MAKMDMFWVALLAMVATCCCSGCHEEERSGLSHFKRGLFNPYDRLDSWRGLDCCSWEGIYCDLDTGHVIGMSVGGYDSAMSVRNSSSHIFRGLLQLQHLESLDLSWIDFHPLGIPSELAMLNKLTSLILSGCGFTGRIPNDMGNMSSLRFLEISSIDGLENRQLGEWIGNLRGLEDLSLAYMNLKMGGDRVVGNIAASLTNLTTLDMSGCGLSGSILSSLVNLTSLSDLTLNNNDFTRQPFPNWISNLTSLDSLWLNDCSLQGPTPSALLSLPYLRYLILSDNPDLKVSMSHIVQHSRKIKMLSLSLTNVGEIPNSIGNMSSLTYLDLSNSNIEGVLPPSVGNLSRLEELYLSGNSLRGSIPWTDLSGLSKLSRLDLESNQLNGSLPSTFGNLSFLASLDLSNNSFSGIIPPSIQNLTSLQGLHLGDNKFHECSVENLVHELPSNSFTPI